MSQATSTNDPIRTLMQKGRGNPYDPAYYSEIVKPGELVDIIELSPLTLTDRRTYNLLIANAWDRIGEPIVHRIAKSALKGTHQGNERIEASLLRLMGTIAIVTIRKDGKSYKRRVQLLGPSDESLEKDGFLHYRIPEELIEILQNSEVYARLKTQVMYCFESKYTLCLYEMTERRIGLEYKQTEEFTIEELRGLLNVPDGKLERFADLNKYCLKVATEEINKLCPFYVDFSPIKKGRKVERIAFHWFPKTSSGKRDAQILIDQHRIVRRAKLRGLAAELPLLLDFGTEPPEK
ncbi:replication initiation protein [Gluconacetobacter diazotrophicus]|uniref:replication initiation protein n=1 Tax=Gluconacetobacter diazotrophicus TaxID=33996 RepID=UPI000173CF5A|nr:replication initiation protein [Gluconacetobacter diazotrophicus]TWB00356.1 replication initiator protein [Gluconacetobacter diazotrophicus]